MLLYIHVPFCRSKCRYCAFVSQTLSKTEEDLLEVYLSGVLEEVALWRDHVGPTQVETVFFGGGTPSLLPPRSVGRILDAVGTSFSLSSGAEITLEANPDSALEPGWLDGVRTAGANRLSLGVQSFDDGFLRLLGRRHTARQAIRCCDAARTAGFDMLSLDLMWGLPGWSGRRPPCNKTTANAHTGRSPQTWRLWQNDLAQAVRLQPEHLSTYGLSLEEGTPLAAAREAGEVLLAPESELSELYIRGMEYLEGQGFLQYELSNCARPGCACRHNLGYWAGREYLGVGPAAVSTLGSRRWTNPGRLASWRAALRGGAVALMEHEAEHLDAPTRHREWLMLRLRTTTGLSCREWQRLTGENFLQDHARLAAALQDNGLARVQGDFFSLTRPGLLVSNAILEHFFRDLEEKRTK